MNQSIQLRDVVSGQRHSFVPRRLVIAGFTGRNPEAVEAHLEELREFGAVVPDATPIFFELDPALLTTASEIVVRGDFTSGEVEPVIVIDRDAWLLTVGSDHTDRNIERESIAGSKQACPKVISGDCVRFEAVPAWDDGELVSWVDAERKPYQEGTLAQILPPADLVGRMAARGIQLGDGDVVFLGTVPVTGGDLRASERFRGALRVAGLDRSLEFSYRVRLDA